MEHLKINNFTFRTNGKFIIFGGPILKHITVIGIFAFVLSTVAQL